MHRISKVCFPAMGCGITGTTFSKKATAIGGLLFGIMGLTGGALLTHKPMEVQMPVIEYNLKSDIKRIE